MMSRSLHMPFSLEQIAPCSNILFSGARIFNMHPTAKRLLEIGPITYLDYAKQTKSMNEKQSNAPKNKPTHGFRGAGFTT